MSDALTYTLNLEGNLQEKLKKINIANEQQLETWAKVQSQVVKATGTMNNMGKSLGSMREKVAALKAQREWIPASNRKAIRTTNKEVKKLENEIQKLESINGRGLKKWFGSLKQGIPILNMITNPIALLSFGLYKSVGALKKSQEAYNKQAIAETQLTAVMRNTMGARKEDVSSILGLASAQQKLGVIGDEVQLAGAQELSTYLTKTDSLKKLMPVMNDMMAQQYGLNASQEQASQIASMLGKVMDGQTGALSRYGYKFDEAQEKILKTGTEAQRAAVLFDVVNASVGGVNQALAQTPEGKLKQQANEAGDLQERLGKLFVSVKSAFAPLVEFINKAGSKILGFFERNESKIRDLAQVIANVLTKTLRVLGGAIMWLFEKINILSNASENTKVAMFSMSSVIITLVSGLASYKLVTTAISIGTKIWTAAQWLLNTALSMNPVGLIIAAIVALIAVIAFLVIKVDGWGKTWSNVVEFCTTIFEGFKSEVTLAWLHIQDTFMSGIELIEAGWYKLQSLWDKDTASRGLKNLEAQRNTRADAIAEQKKVSDALNEKLSTMKVFELSLNDTSLSDVTAGIKSKLGIEDPRIPGADFNLGSGDSFGGNSVGDETASAIATGGSKTTHITINLGQLVEQINIAKDGFREGAVEMRDMILDELTRVLSMAQGQV